MMNIRNLGSEESVGVKYIDGICTKFWLKLWFIGIFVIYRVKMVLNAIQKQISK